MMAATNRPDMLDPALLRPGRFDRQIMVPLPTQEERVDDPQGPLPRQEDRRPTSTSTSIARGTPGMAGADLANLVNEAALFAVRRGAHEIHAEDFDAARDRVLMGLKRDVDGADRGGEGDHRLPRGRPRGARLRARARRPDPQGDDPARPGWRSASPSSSRSRSATSTSGSTSPTRSSWRSAAASPRRSCSATSVDRRRRTTSCASPSSPARWCASGACPSGSGRWRGARRARCSSARTSCTPATTPTRPPGSSTKRSSGSCAHEESRARTHPRGCTAAASTRVARALLEHETRRRRRGVARSSTTRWAARSAATARSSGPTGPSWRSSRRPRTAARRRRAPARSRRGS